jgi:hypothetical protein
MDWGSWIRDTGSGKNLFRIPESDPGSKKSIGSRIRIRNTDSLLELQLEIPQKFKRKKAKKTM